MTENFWRCVLLCQLGVAVLTVRILSATTHLGLAPMIAAAVITFWSAPAMLFICALVLTQKTALVAKRSVSDWVYALRAVVSETVWFTPTALAMSFRSRPPKARPRSHRPAEPPQPVLLIHGIACNRGIWNPLVRHLQQARFGPVLAINLKPALSDIECHAAIVVRALQELRRQAPGTLISVVAHSMGGLVAREVLRQAGPAMVKQLVTVGSPHHGTVFARLLRCKLTQQMRPDSAWLAALNAAQESRLPVSISSIYSLEDWLIRPPCSALLKGADAYELRGIGHLGLLRERTSINCIMSALTRE